MLKNKKILITGATGGIGKAIAFLFAKNNAELFLTGRNIRKLEKLKSQILRLYKVKISIYVFDISNYDEIKNAFKNIFLKTKNIDVLINNAGILKDNFIGMISNRDINNIINTNLIGPINFTQLVSKIMSKKNSSIINISSIVGKSGNSGQVLYSSSKSGLLGFTLSAAKEFASKGIRVNAICPGVVATPLAHGPLDADRRQKFRDRFARYQPIGRVGEAEDIAQTALFLASDDSTFITGTAMVVDGGAHAGRPWHRQSEMMTGQGPIKLYRPEGR